MKKTKRDKAPGPKSADVLLLKDLSPVNDVKGGSAKRVFGQRAVSEGRKPATRGAKEKKVPRA